MASRAKNKPNNKRTYASAVVGVDEKSHFAELAVCNLKAPTNMAHSCIPNTKEEFSFFIDKKSTDATEEQILLAVNIDGVIRFTCEHIVTLFMVKILFNYLTG